MRILSMLFIFCILSLSASAGIIKGKVTDEKGEALIGATVLIKGTANGTVADIEGDFFLNTTPGNYTLEIKFMGYQTREIAHVTVTETTPTVVNIVLKESASTQLQEVVVRSSFRKENIGALYTLQKTSAAISDGISADIIRKTPDRNAGEVLTRVGGTTVKDGRFVIVRGLSDRYNTALVDNAVLPSTEANTKAFSFDIIPSALIDNIIISKAATPELPGDFAGGAVQILTKEIPEKDFASVTVGVGYNTASTFNTFKSGTRSPTDFLGFDNGTRKLPENFPSNAAIIGNLSAEENKAAAAKLPSDNKISERRALPQLNLQASMGKVKHLRNGSKWGGVFALTYAHSERYEGDIERNYFQYDYTDQVYKYASSVGVLANFSYHKAKSRFSFKNIYNRVFNDQFLYREGTHLLNNKDIRYYAFDLTQKSLFKTSLEGTHHLGIDKGKINWVLSYARITNTQPDQKKITYARYAGMDNTEPFRAELGTLSKLNNRYFSDLGENIYTGGLNYALPLKMFQQTHTLKAGWMVQLRQRNFKARFMGLVLDELKMDPAVAEEIKTRPLETLYGDDLIEQGYYKLSEIYDPANTYDAYSLTNAAYVLLDNKLSEKLRIVWGARMEFFNLHLGSKDNTGNVNIDRTWNNLLPSVNITYALSDKVNLRASYYRSVARPEFREIAPFAYYDYELPANTYGNTDLKTTTIDNADIRYEIYPRKGEIISISAFYKKFTHPIEPKMYDVNSSGLERTYRNAPGAVNVGAEFEMRKSLDFIASSLNRFSFYTNLAYIYSKVDLSTYTSSVTGEVVGDANRPLAGQSPYVINIGLGYATPDNKFSLNVAYNRIGRRVYLVSGELLPGVWENPRDMLDFQTSYNLSKKSTLRLNIKDIFNQPYLLYFDYNKNGHYDPETASKDAQGNAIQDQTFKRTPRTGSNISLSYTLSF